MAVGAVLHYGVSNPTHDIDTWKAVEASLAAAVEKARQITGLPVPFQTSGVADPPYGFESRLERVLPHLMRLTVQVPERHDLVLMKTMRCAEHDVDTIAEIHAHAPLDLEILFQRFTAEMGQAIGNPKRIRGNFLVVIERLFPNEVERIATMLPE